MLNYIICRHLLKIFKVASNSEGIKLIFLKVTSDLDEVERHVRNKTEERRMRMEVDRGKQDCSNMEVWPFFYFSHPS